MRCNKCKTEMVTRNGKFGAFYACPKSNPSDNHGTVSAGQKAYSFVYHSDDLDTHIHRQMMNFGVRMTDLDLFVEGGYEASLDDDNHWMNTRPY
jgi:hypothetical protein